MTDDLNSIYRLLRKNYGRQGWWPIVNPATGISEYGTGAPKSEADIFEIAIGAILTQNVAWLNVEKAILSLKKKNLMDPQRLYKARHDTVANCITSSGYYNQKTIKIKNFLLWFREYNFTFESFSSMRIPDLRNELLSVNGIGPETADSILLYGLNRKIFVVDAYTRRIYSRLRIIDINSGYDEIRIRFEKGTSGGVAKYSEYHALIVAHGKDICRNKPLCGTCCLRDICPSADNMA